MPSTVRRGREIVVWTYKDHLSKSDPNEILSIQTIVVTEVSGMSDKWKHEVLK